MHPKYVIGKQMNEKPITHLVSGETRKFSRGQTFRGSSRVEWERVEEMLQCFRNFEREGDGGEKGWEVE